MHLLAVGGWIGADVVLASLVATAWLTGDRALAGAVLQAVAAFAVPVITTATVTTLASGVALGAVTGHGVLVQRWTAAKLAINTAMLALVPLGLAPAVAAAAAHGRALSDGSTTVVDVGDLAYPPLVSPLLIAIAMIIAIRKPWGPLRRRPPTTAR